MLEAKDGKGIYALVQASKVLDLNPEYTYMLLGTHFQQSCAVAEIDGKLAGFMSAYIPPNQLDVLFIWQATVVDEHQQQGLALAMLKDILRRPCCGKIKYIHATIAPSNSASRAFFASLARGFHANFHECPMFPVEYFSKSHEEEPLCVIGPLLHPLNEEIV
ncbi:MAG: diaminobutyrate acetyltransferase [Candidatus Eutrophobiaceae bacterium]